MTQGSPYFYKMMTRHLYPATVMCPGITWISGGLSAQVPDSDSPPSPAPEILDNLHLGVRFTLRHVKDRKTELITAPLTSNQHRCCFCTSVGSFAVNSPSVKRRCRDGTMRKTPNRVGIANTTHCPKEFQIFSCKANIIGSLW